MAAAGARPGPSAAPNAARPSPSPAASAIRPLDHGPPPASAAVSASAGFAIMTTTSTAQNHPTIRRMNFPSRPPAVPSSPLIPSAPTGTATKTSDSLVLVTDRQRDVDRAQHREHERLYDGHERPENVEDDRDAELGERREDLHHLMVREHVGEETDAERHRPEEMAEHLHHRHQGREEHNRP